MPSVGDVLKYQGTGAPAYGAGVAQTQSEILPVMSSVAHPRKWLRISGAVAAGQGPLHLTTIGAGGMAPGAVGAGAITQIDDADGLGTQNPATALGPGVFSQFGWQSTMAGALLLGQRRHNWYLSSRFKVPDVAGKKLWVGMATAVSAGVDSVEYDAGAMSVVAFRYHPTQIGGRWGLYAKAGGVAGTVVDYGGGVVVANTEYAIELWSDNANARVYGRVNGGASVYIDAGLMINTMALPTILWIFGDSLTGNAVIGAGISYDGYFVQD